MEEGGRRREEEGEMGNGRRKESYREERKRERKSLPFYHSQSVSSAGEGKRQEGWRGSFTILSLLRQQAEEKRQEGWKGRGGGT